ncbi:peptide synthetase, partial [Rhodococcus erythropolis]
VGLDDDFFALGGNSLIATRVAARLGQALDAQVPVRVLFEASSVELLAARVESEVGSGARAALTAMVRPERIPLSLAQQRMWFLNQLDPHSAVYNVPLAIQLIGELNIEALQAAVWDVLSRHESLRTWYPTDSEGPMQVVLPATDLRLDLNPVVVDKGSVMIHVSEIVQRGFDVKAEAPVRVKLFALDSNTHVFVVVIHHIAGDGSSIAPLGRDVMVAYEARSRGEVPGWAPLAVQYADYALWQRDVLGSVDDPKSVAYKQIAYWRTQLADIPTVLELPSDRPRPAVQSMRGEAFEFEIGAELHTDLLRLAKTNNATIFMVVHAAVAILLSKLSNSADIVVGTPVAGRGEAALDQLVGMFVNTLALRTRLDHAASFESFLREVRENDLTAFANSAVPFEWLVDELDPLRSTAHSPLFQVLLVFQNFEQNRFELPGLSVAAVEADLGTAKYDLQITLSERATENAVPAGLYGSFDYATDLFDGVTIQAIVDRLLRILEAITSTSTVCLAAIEILSSEERKQLVSKAVSHESVDCVDETLVSLFDKQVVCTPDSIAISFNETELSYGQFDARVNQLARYLISVGVGPEVFVGVAISRSVELVVALYAVLKAGGAYVPIDPDHPADRIAHIVETAAPLLILTTERDGFESAGRQVVDVCALDLRTVSARAVADQDRHLPLRPENTAYLIFTSGSTGRPKGVTLTHRATVNQLLWAQMRYGLDESDVVLHKTPITFDISVWELFWTLQTGARLVIAIPDGHRDADYIAKTIEEHRVTTVHFVPSMLNAYMSAISAPMSDSVRRVFVAGEALSAATVRQFAAYGAAELHNWYGPAEVEVVTAWEAVSEFSRVPIGEPVAGTGVAVLDSALNMVPVGVSGELYLAGPQLSRGYHGRADLSADRFVANPFGAVGDRMYRTGDLVRWNSSGELEYIGRSDFQVKLRGQRIELGEIESALIAHDSVADAVVVLHTDAVFGDSLIAYVIGTAVDSSAVLNSAREVLPSYMVPSQIMVLDAFPLNASGKLDRKLLPAPVFEAAVFRAPVTAVEEIVAS